MPQISKTREVSSGCYVVVQFTCPPELKRWDGHLFKFLQQASSLHLDERNNVDPATHFPDGELCYNRVTKLIDNCKCVFDFFLVSSRRVSLTFDMLEQGSQPNDVEVFFP